jgi:regulator of replication initiation timing
MEQLGRLSAEVSRIEEQIGVLIREQSTAVEEVQPFYRAEIEKLHQQLRRMKTAYIDIQQKTAAMERANATQQMAREELARLSVEKFWEQDSRTINQLLHRLMGKARLVILNGQIIGTAEKPYRNRRAKITSRASQE